MPIGAFFMEFLTGVLKKYVNLSLWEIFLFSLLGLILFQTFQTPTFLSFLHNYSYQKELDSFPFNAFFILIWFLAYFIIKKIIQSIFKYIFSFFSYAFKTKDWPRKWEYQGNIRLADAENSLLVTDSNSGCLLKNHYWKNFELSFDCMFPTNNDDQTLGIAFRAKSLSDYLMIQINGNEKEIVPHIRMEGNWETPRRWTYKLTTTLDRNVFYKVKLNVVNKKVELYMDNNKLLDWNIPTHSDLILAKSTDKHEESFVPRIDFSDSYGRIGFRAYQGECAVIKNLYVKRIASIL